MLAGPIFRKSFEVSALLVLTLLTACDGWEYFEDEMPLGKNVPFELSLVNSEPCPLPEGLDPKQVTILSYKVQLKGGDKHGVPANYFYASLLMTDGTRYLADYPGCEPALSNPPVYPGDTETGYLNFPVPPSKTPATLVYAPVLEAGVGKPSIEHTVTISVGETSLTETSIAETNLDQGNPEAGQ